MKNRKAAAQRGGGKELLITGCSDPMRWYAPHVGERAPYLGDAGPDGYKSREAAGYVNFVIRQDAKIVEAEEYAQ